MTLAQLRRKSAEYGLDRAQHSTHSSTSSQLSNILIDPYIFILPMREKQSRPEGASIIMSS
jgi:hypothetical protein